MRIQDLDYTEPGEDHTALQRACLELRTARATRSTAWSFASKMCARKRPYLAPVRDNVVCELLNAGRRSAAGLESQGREEALSHAYARVACPSCGNVDEVRLGQA